MMNYRFNVYYGSSLLHEDDELFETEEEAYEEGENYKELRIKEYEIDGAEYDESEFDIVIIEEECDEDYV